MAQNRSNLRTKGVIKAIIERIKVVFCYMATVKLFEEFWLWHFKCDIYFTGKTRLCHNFLYSVIRQVILIIRRLPRFQIVSFYMYWALKKVIWNYITFKVTAAVQPADTWKVLTSFWCRERLFLILISQMAARMTIKCINHVSVKRGLLKRCHHWQFTVEKKISEQSIDLKLLKTSLKAMYLLISLNENKRWQ